MPNVYEKGPIMVYAAVPLLLLTAPFFPGAHGHGWLKKPLARQYCDGRQPHQFGIEGTAGQGGYPREDLGGFPGVCGDPFMGHKKSDFKGLPCEPQETYTEGSVITVELGMHADHGGVHEFSICDSKDLTQACFDKNKLVIDKSGETDWWDSEGGGLSNGGSHSIDVRLPKGMTCEHCVMQWTWWTAHMCIPYKCDPARCGRYAESPLPMCDSMKPKRGQTPQTYKNCGDFKIVASGQGGGEVVGGGSNGGGNEGSGNGGGSTGGMNEGSGNGGGSTGGNNEGSGNGGGSNGGGNEGSGNGGGATGGMNEGSGNGGGSTGGNNGGQGGEPTGGEEQETEEDKGGKPKGSGMFEGGMKAVYGSNSCTGGYVANGLVPIAMNKEQYGGGANCGSCVSACVQKGEGEECFYAFVDTVCQHCGQGDLGYHPADGSKGDVVSWEWMPCDTNDIKFEPMNSGPYHARVRVIGGPSGVEGLECNGQVWNGPKNNGVWSVNGDGSLGCEQDCTVSFVDGSKAQAAMPAGLNGECKGGNQGN